MLHATPVGRGAPEPHAPAPSPDRVPVQQKPQVHLARPRRVVGPRLGRGPGRRRRSSSGGPEAAAGGEAARPQGLDLDLKALEMAGGGLAGCQGAAEAGRTHRPEARRRLHAKAERPVRPREGPASAAAATGAAGRREVVVRALAWGRVKEGIGAQRDPAERGPRRPVQHGEDRPVEGPVQGHHHRLGLEETQHLIAAAARA